jgi:dihydrofolate reductase
MLHGQKIVFVSIVDNDNETIPDLGFRIWHHEKAISRFLKTENCIMGRKAYDVTQWKGPNSWVLTKNLKWRRSGIGTMHNLDDIHLFTEGPVYVLGGNSIQSQLAEYVDEVHLYVLNNRKGKDPWITLDMKDWKPINYVSKGVWSYAHMEKVMNYDPHDLNQELFNE